MHSANANAVGHGVNVCRGVPKPPAHYLLQMGALLLASLYALHPYVRA